MLEPLQLFEEETIKEEDECSRGVSPLLGNKDSLLID